MKKLLIMLAVMFVSLNIKTQTNPICTSHTLYITTIVPDRPAETYRWNAINVCDRLDVTLVASGADSYQWRNGATSDTIRPVLHYAANPFGLAGFAIENGVTCEMNAYVNLYACYEAFYSPVGIEEINKASPGIDKIEYVDIMGNKVEKTAGIILAERIYYKDGSVKQTKILEQ